MSSDSRPYLEVESFSLERPERYLAVLAKYGKGLITSPFHTTEFS